MTILDRSHAPRLCGLSVTLLALLVVVPVTLAHASPPDQTCSPASMIKLISMMSSVS